VSHIGPEKEKPEKESKDAMWIAYARYSGLALLVPASTVIGYGIGYGLDQFFATHYLKVVFLLLGTIGGFIELIRGLTRP
jgi:F0F1-type ATP synthase assembly protein I